MSESTVQVNHEYHNRIMQAHLPDRSSMPWPRTSLVFATAGVLFAECSTRRAADPAGNPRSSRSLHDSSPPSQGAAETRVRVARLPGPATRAGAGRAAAFSRAATRRAVVRGAAAAVE